MTTTTKIKTLEVRCCCDPTKVLGYITHPQLQEIGDRYEFQWNERATSDLVSLGFEVGSMVRKRIELVVDRITEGVYTFEAVKNNDYSIEALMRVPGFSVNK